MTSARVTGTGDDIRLTDWTRPVETIPALAPWRQPAQGVDPAGAFLHDMRRVSTEHDLNSVCDRHLRHGCCRQ